MLWYTSALILGILVSSAPRVEFLASAGENINGLPLNNPQGLAVNPSHEEFLIADALNDRIVIIDTTGAAIFTFSLMDGHHNPFGIAVNSTGEIIISPMDTPELWIYDYSGRYLSTIALPGTVLPGRLAVDKDDNIFIVNRAGKGILQIDKDGAILKTFDSPEVKCRPSGICFDNKGNILLISSEGNAVTAINTGNQVIYSLGVHGQKLEEFSHPSAAIVETGGNMWVIDSFCHHIKRFDPKRNYIDMIGQRGIGLGEFFFPVDLKMTPGGKVGVLEKGSGRLQIFRLVYDK